MSIELSDVHMTFNLPGGGRNEVLKGLDLVIPSGSTTVIIGLSGTGKSVILKLICGLLKPDSGSVRVSGVEMTTAPRQQIYALRSRLGYLFQLGALFDSMNVHDNVAFGMLEKRRRLQKQRLTVEDVRRVVVQRLADVGLDEDVRLKMPADLSGGMKKRVALARLLAMDLEYILYDEPTTGLDPITADTINELIRETSRRFKNVTSIVVTHDIASAVRVGHRIAMLYDGRILESGTPDEMLATRNEYVQQFFQGRSQGPIKVLKKKESSVTEAHDDGSMES